MELKTKNEVITVEVIVQSPVEKVWDCWTNPKHIIHWNYASEDWHTPFAENDLRIGGRFISRMEAKDGKMGFDFSGEYVQVEKHKLIEYVLEDARHVKVSFNPNRNETTVTEVFDAEKINPAELQQAGWQAILNNFKNYVESGAKPKPLHFSITIDASVEKVYQCMLDQEYYKQWTTAFNPTSFYKGSWEKGSKILFLCTDHEEKTSGLVSRIAENVPNKYVSIEHLGLYQGDTEITSGSGVDDWAGAMENYTFSDKNGKTLLEIDLDSNDEFISYFTETWPKALKILKEICEKPA
jgi:uncharacterized protein YndB with AHSA1/START domain